MLEFVLCPSCGFNLSDKYDAFTLMRKKLTEHHVNILHKNVHPEKLELYSDTNINLNDIFATLHIRKFCCRLHMTTAFEIRSL